MWLVSRFLPRRSSGNKDKPTMGDATEALMSDYGAALMARAESGRVVSEVNNLPAPKDRMRAAIMEAMRTRLRTQRLGNSLKACM